MTITAAHSALPDLTEAVIAELKAHTEFTSIAAGPFDPPKESQVTFPYVSLGEHIESNWYSLGNTGRQVLFMFHIWSQQQGTGTFGFKEAYRIMDTITGILEPPKTLTLTNFTMTKYGFQFENSVKMLDPDGITKHLVATYRTKLKAK
jgi:hypothetical protein